MAWIVLSLRRLMAEPVGVLGLVGFALATAFVFAVAPRLLERVSGDALTSEIAGASSGDRNLQLSTIARRGPALARPGDLALASLADVDATGGQFASKFAPALEAMISQRASLVETPLWRVVTPTRVGGEVAMQIQPGVERHISVVAGRLPGGQVSSVPDTRPGAPSNGLPLAVYQAAMSEAAAAELGVSAGQRLLLTPDGTDSLTQGFAGGAAIDIVGIYRATDPGDGYWIGDTLVQSWATRPISVNVEFAETTVLLAPDAYAQFLSGTGGQGLPLRYSWRYYVDPGRVDAGRLDELVDATRRLEGLFPPTTGSTLPGVPPSIRSGLFGLLVAHQAAWRSAGAVLSVGAIGAAAIAGAALAVIMLLASTGRRRALALGRARGASGRQVLRVAGLEALLLVGPAAAIGVAAAVLLVRSDSLLPSVVAGLAVAAAGAVVMLLVTAPTAAGVATESARGARISRRPSARRLVLEGLLVALAAAGAVLLRDRGLGVAAAGAGAAAGPAGSAAGSAGLAGADPLVSAVPALVGLAAGVAAVRLYPYPTQLLARFAARGRGLVAVLAVRRAVRGAATGPVLLTLMAAATVGGFASATVVHLDSAADAIAWHEVGAPFRLLTPSGVLPATLDPSLPGTSGSALASIGASSLSSGAAVQVMTVDAAAYQQLAAGTPADPQLPLSLLEDAVGPLPAIISGPASWGRGGVAVGDTFGVTFGRSQVPVRAVAARDTFSALDTTRPFVVLSRAQLAARSSDALPAPTTAFIAAPDDAAPSLRAALSGYSAVTLEGRAERAAAVRDLPVAGAVSTGIAAAAVASLAYAALAVVAALALAGASRQGEVAFLRAIGVSDRQSGLLVLAEYGPAVALAFVVGAALGVALFAFLLPGLGLGSVVGSPLDVPVSVAPVHLFVLLAAIAGIVAIGWILASALQRRAEPSAALRVGVE